MQPLAPRGEEISENRTGQGRVPSGGSLFERIASDNRFRARLFGRFATGRGRAGNVVSVFGLLALIVGGGYAASSPSGAGFSLASVSQFAGFQAANLVVNGNHSTETAAVNHALAPQLSGSLFDFDVVAARKALLANPWFSSAQVRKVYPDTLVVDVRERIPFAFWKSENRVQVIARDGTVLGEAQPRHLVLPQVVGAGANSVAPEFVAAVAKLPEIANRSAAFVRVAKRRWNLVLKDDTRVLLPEEGWRAALVELDELHAKNRLLDRNLEQIDLRLADRLVVRLREADAENRRQYFEELTKDGRRKT